MPLRSALPQEVGRAPASPFVMNFVGDVNHLPASSQVCCECCGCAARSATGGAMRARITASSLVPPRKASSPSCHRVNASPCPTPPAPPAPALPLLQLVRKMNFHTDKPFVMCRPAGEPQPAHCWPACCWACRLASLAGLAILKHARGMMPPCHGHLNCPRCSRCPALVAVPCQSVTPDGPLPFSPPFP